MYYIASDGKEVAMWSTAVLLIEKRQRYLLQGYEWRRDSNMPYCRISNEEERAVWSTAGILKTSATMDLLLRKTNINY
jgi:hypothetical protein